MRRTPRVSVRYVLAIVVVWVGTWAALSAQQSSSPHGDLTLACSACHTTSGWRPLADSLGFDHGADTGFGLADGHARPGCSDCHSSLVFAAVGSACADCHEDAHAGELGVRCAECHGPASWENQREMFDIHETTLFPLLAAHASLDCESCHGSQRTWEFAATPTRCGDCHIDAFTSTSNPDHQLAGFSPECESCHRATASGWRETDFVHPEPFALVGAHNSADCTDCHAENFAGTPNLCASCHDALFTDPDHRSTGFSQDCELCHTADGWRPSHFQHALFGYPLEGSHVGLSCESCHGGGYVSTSVECVGCHLEQYEAAAEPDHDAADFSTDCSSCHSQSSWLPATWEHTQQTGHQLLGAHEALSCTACHVTDFPSTPSDCMSCHQEGYDQTSNPDHRLGTFAADCATCHSESVWTPSTFNHTSQGGYALEGAHVPLDCNSCHVDTFAGTPSECVACHRGDFDQSTDPDHLTSGFPETCSTCHSQWAWEPATFDHSQTTFPLTDSHVQLTCNACHADGYTGTPIDCYACHTEQYVATSDPNHEAAGFPITCETCHRPTTWDDAIWDHDSLFPIYSGEHRGEWTDCADCHLDTSSYLAFECIFCHEHNQSEMDDEHQGENGYSYDSAACFSCHPDGREDGDRR